MTHVDRDEATPVDRDDVVRRVRAAASDAGTTCSHCQGEGRVRDGQNMIVHSMGGMFGADWSADGVAEAVRDAQDVAWVDHWNLHDLRVTTAKGRVYHFEVPNPRHDDEVRAP